MNDDTFQDLKNISNSSGKTISKVSAELIESNIKNYLSNQSNQNNGGIGNSKIPRYEKNHYANLVGTLNIAI